MDSSFVNYDGRSVHDMIEALLAMSGDPEAIRRLQESINAVDQRAQSSIAVVNAAIDQLDADKQDAGYYTENGGGVFGTTARFNDGASVGKFVQGPAVKGIRIYGQHTTDSQGYKGESLVFNTDTKTIKQYVQDSSDDSWSEKAVYSADEDTGWLLLKNSENLHISNGLYYRRKNGVVFLYIGGPIDIELTANTPTVVGTLPDGFRPSTRPMQGTIELNNSLGLVIVMVNGEIHFKGYTAVPINSIARGSISFPA